MATSNNPLPGMHPKRTVLLLCSQVCERHEHAGNIWGSPLCLINLQGSESIVKPLFSKVPNTLPETGIPNVTNPYNWAWQQHLFFPTAVMDTLLERKLKEHPGGPAGLPQASYLSSSEICHRLRLLLEGYYCLRHTSGRKSCYIQL